MRSKLVARILVVVTYIDLAVALLLKSYLIDKQDAWKATPNLREIPVFGGGLLAPGPIAHVYLAVNLLPFVLLVAALLYGYRSKRG